MMDELLVIQWSHCMGGAYAYFLFGDFVFLSVAMLADEDL